MAHINAANERDSSLVRWGLVPGWVKEPKEFTLLINSRSETAATKPSFRNAMRHRRSLLPASGFYEWYRPAGSDKNQKKQAYWITPSDGGIVVFGGLMETWCGKEGSEVDTGCILTTQSNKLIGNIHHRMPVVIKPENFEEWLDCKNREPRDVAHLMQAVEDGYFTATAVGDDVNKVANSGPEIQKPLPSDQVRHREVATNTKSSDDQMDLF